MLLQKQLCLATTGRTTVNYEAQFPRGTFSRPQLISESHWTDDHTKQFTVFISTIMFDLCASFNANKHCKQAQMQTSEFSGNKVKVQCPNEQANLESRRDNKQTNGKHTPLCSRKHQVKLFRGRQIITEEGGEQRQEAGNDKGGGGGGKTGNNKQEDQMIKQKITGI